MSSPQLKMKRRPCRDQRSDENREPASFELGVGKMALGVVTGGR